MSNSAKLKDVFSGIEFSSSVQLGWGIGDITNITLCRENASMIIEFRFNSADDGYYAEGMKNYMRDELLAKFDFLKEVEIKLRFRPSSAATHIPANREIAPRIPENPKNSYNPSKREVAPQISKNPKNQYNPYVKKEHNGSGVVPKILGSPIPLDAEMVINDEVIIEGVVFKIENRETRSGKMMYIFDIYDKRGAITCKFFQNKEAKMSADTLLVVGNSVRIAGKISDDSFIHEAVVMVNKICAAESREKARSDNAPKKRVELHLHTNMSQLDAINSAASYIERAANWGHSAIAITDHGNMYG
ncbi:MAG: PHP domain-containing protein, partial [Defluviitaleaceae bacterium]|nr:PHP domain-containing protein [Defluviitaleaceae bacterium]